MRITKKFRVKPHRLVEVTISGPRDEVLWLDDFDVFDEQEVAASLGTEPTAESISRWLAERLSGSQNDVTVDEVRLGCDRQA